MREIIKYIFIVALLLLSYTQVIAQTGYGTNGELEHLYNQQNEEGKTDTLGGKKPFKERKPLESYLFADSLKKDRAFAWNYNPYTNRVVQVDVDTFLTNFNNEYFFLGKKRGMGSFYLGNLGAPTTSVEYSQRESGYSLAFLNPYKEYLYNPSNVIFYNSKVAYSQFSYFTSGQRAQAEEIFNLTHSQNISPSSSFNITYRNNRTRGMYENQQSINKNFSAVFAHTGKRYTTHFGYVFNSGDMRENGGVSDLSEIRDTVINLTTNIGINLRDAKTRFKGNGFFHTQSLAIPLSHVSSEYDSLLNLFPEPLSSLDSLKLARRRRISSSEVATGAMLFIGTTVSYDSYHKIYTDTNSATEEGYYDNWYINPTTTRDSIRETNFDMKLFAQFQPFNSDGLLSLMGGGIGYENSGYYYFLPDNYLTVAEKQQKKSMYVYGDANGRWRRYVTWNGHIKYYPIGYRTQDLEVGGDLSLIAYTKKGRSVTLKGDVNFKTQSPTFWEQEFYSNHFRWSNDFKNEVTTDIDVSLSIPSINFELGATQTLATNTIYYNHNALPTQYSGALSVTELYLQKNFVSNGFHLRHKVLLQTSSDEIVAPVPALAINLEYLYEFTVVKDVLTMEVGANGRYNTEYYGYGYNPAVGQFYNQRSVKTGGYPTVDVFVTGKWKRLRFLVKAQNANYELFGGRNYFDMAYYPHNRFMLRYGISWSFYD